MALFARLNFVRSKDAFLLLMLGSVFFLSACDQVRWGGVAIDVRPPEPVPTAEVEIAVAEVERPPEPIRSGPLAYLVERDGTGGILIPVAEWRGGTYAPLPASDETPEWVQRFPLERWEVGTEFILMDRGVRAGTFVSDGSATWHDERCLARPAGRGRLELRPEASGSQRFLAFRKEDLVSMGAEGQGVPGLWPGVPQGNELTSAAQTLARFVLTRANIPWPPSIPDIVKARGGVILAPGANGVAASFVFGGELEVGTGLPGGYGLFVLAAADPATQAGWTPLWIWYQTMREGKAVPQLLAGGALPFRSDPESQTATPSDFILDVFGARERSFAILGYRDDTWGLLYQDACGTSPASGAARAWR